MIVINETYKNFNNFVSELVTYHLRSNPEFTIDKLAEATKLSSSFVQKCVSLSTQKHFNLRHLYIISNVMKIPIEKFMPSKENYKLITNDELTDKEWMQLNTFYFNEGE